MIKSKPKTKEKRVKIPLQTQLKLWVLSAGRCQFPGCNKSLLKDSLTLKEDNYANIAHIVADSPRGPRGDARLSPALSKDFSNLMLMCTTHHRLIDGRNKGDYSSELLRLYKAKHEDRIRIQTEILDEHTTTVLRFLANIGSQPISISIAQTYRAIFPNYPEDEKGVVIDLTSIKIDDDNSYWEVMSKNIKIGVDKIFAQSNDDKKINHLSIFAIAPIPLLMKLGYCIGNVIKTHIYQSHRDTQDWVWKSVAPAEFKYNIKKTDVSMAKNVALVLSLSGKILEDEIKHIVNNDFAKFEISIDSPKVDFLKATSQLDQFKVVYRDAISEIREKYGHDCRIHLFPAIPVPIAIACGSVLLHNVDPEIFIYQKNQKDGLFSAVLTLNKSN